MTTLTTSTLPPWLTTTPVDSKTADFLERHRYTGATLGWAAIVGHEHAQRELRVAAMSLERRDLADRLGVPLVKGLLLTGPSGSGKTLLARAFAGLTERPVFVLSAADLDAGRIGRIYELLAATPSVVVIDEIDLIARRSYGTASRSKTVVALCVALDGIVPVSGPITIGLTAEDPDDLDPSVVRSGRLTTKIVLEPPDRAERLELWQLYAGRLPGAEPLDLEDAASRSQGLTGADIAAITTAAAGLALADGLDALDQAHLDEALERRGLVRRVPTLDGLARRATAIHEAGHAVFAFTRLGREALTEVAIARTGRGEGHVTVSREWSEANDLAGRHWRIEVQLALAGVLAEELVLGAERATFGAGRDLARATSTVLRAAEHGLLPDLGYASTDAVERGVDGDGYDFRGAPSMREALWTAVRSTIDVEAAAARATLAGCIGAIERLADRLVVDGVLAGRPLIDALIEAGAVEGDLGANLPAEPVR